MVTALIILTDLLDRSGHIEGMTNQDPETRVISQQPGGKLGQKGQIGHKLDT